MAKLTFTQLEFERTEEGLKVTFLKNFYFILENSSLEKIGHFMVKRDSIDFQSVSEESAQRKFNHLFSNAIITLKSKLNNHPTVYIHRNSGIPLIGSSAFGIIDRNTTLIEIKPITGCNLNCIYCSVDEGLSTRKMTDFLVEKDYLVDELKKLIEFKETEGIEIHIGTHGEPLLYEPLAELIHDISLIPNVKRISMDTNGTLLTEAKVDELVKAGLTQFNLSLNAIDPKIAMKMAGCAYDVEKIKAIARYISKKSGLILTPVLLSGINEDEIPKLISFAKEIGAGKNCPPIGIQNFLSYRFGRNPTKALDFEEFYKKISDWEKKHDIQLLLDAKDFNIKKTKKLPSPFKKGDTITIQMICDGRMSNEKIGVLSDRNITVMGVTRKAGPVKVKIIRSKHNIFVANALR